MVIFSTHLLNSLNGKHANKVKVTIFQINSQGEKKFFLNSETDEDGRISHEFNLSHDDYQCTYEMQVMIGEYFSIYDKNFSDKIVSEIVVRFCMKVADKKYHIPIIISPNSYSIWWSD